MIVCFSGASGSGKTTVIESVVRELSKKGWDVGAIKHTHHKIELDKKGKDTMRMREAGAKNVCIASKGGCFMFLGKSVSSPEELEDIFSDADIIIAEGFKKTGKNIIEVCTKPRIRGVMAVVSDYPVKTNVPLFKRNEGKRIANFIEKRFL